MCSGTLIFSLRINTSFDLVGNYINIKYPVPELSIPSDNHARVCDIDTHIDKCNDVSLLCVMCSAVETSLHTDEGSTLHQLLLTPDKVSLENLTGVAFQVYMVTLSILKVY